MRKAEMGIRVRNVKVPVNAVPLETCYCCINCGNLVEGEHVTQHKYGSCCPICESSSIYPVARWLNGKERRPGRG